MMDMSERGIDLIAEFEGFRPTPYNDPVGHCTVGYGELLHLGPCTPEELARPPITEEQGYAYLREKVKPYSTAVAAGCPNLNQNQHDALTSLCYNIGVGGFGRSSVRAAANTRGDVCAELRRIVRGTDGVVYPGLVRRREAECGLYYEPVEDEMNDEVRAAFAAVLAQQGELGRKIDGLQNLMALSLPLIADGKTAELADLLKRLRGG